MIACTCSLDLAARSVQIMRKLSGAKDKLGLRVHGLIVGSPEKKRSDPAVLRSICSSILPNGKNEVRAMLHRKSEHAKLRPDSNHMCYATEMTCAVSARPCVLCKHKGSLSRVFQPWQGSTLLRISEPCMLR